MVASFYISISNVQVSQFLQVLVNTYYIFFFGWDWGLNSGLHTCKVGALLLELHLQSVLFWLFWRWGSRKISAHTGLKPQSSCSQPPNLLGLQVWATSPQLICLFYFGHPIGYEVICYCGFDFISWWLMMSCIFSRVYSLLGLNVCFPPQFICWNLNPKLLLLRGGTTFHAWD
jgi:hypothetical protein